VELSDAKWEIRYNKHKSSLFERFFMNHVKIRLQEISDAERFCEILNNDNFIYFPIRPSIEEERSFLLQNHDKMKNNFEYNYGILFDERLIGGIGIKINQHNTYIGEIGYFIDEAYWKKGTATEAVKLIEKIGFNDLNLERIEILMVPENIGSVKVAENCKYKREGLLKNRIKIFQKFYDAYLYGKIKEEYLDNIESQG